MVRSSRPVGLTPDAPNDACGSQGQSRNSAVVAATAIKAAKAQHATVTVERVGAAITARLAEAIVRFDAETDAIIEARLRQDRPAGSNLDNH